MIHESFNQFHVDPMYSDPTDDDEPMWATEIYELQDFGDCRPAVLTISSQQWLDFTCIDPLGDYKVYWNYGITNGSFLLRCAHSCVDPMNDHVGHYPRCDACKRDQRDWFALHEQYPIAMRITNDLTREA
jgi:hypothetical protein